MARPFVAAALARDTVERYRIEDVLRALLNATMQLWISWDDEAQQVEAAVVTEIIQYPRARDLNVFIIGGRNIWRWRKPMLELLRWFARDMGCANIRGAGREGLRYFARHAGFTERGCILERRVL